MITIMTGLKHKAQAARAPPLPRTGQFYTSAPRGVGGRAPQDASDGHARTKAPLGF